MGQYTTEMIAKYNRALDAIENFSNSDLDDAPVLSNYVPVMTPLDQITLFGDVEDHPGLGTTLISTSDLVHFDARAGLARTVSRWYRLGPRDAVKAGDLVFVGRLYGCVIADGTLQKMLDKKAQEFRKLMN